MKGNRDILWKGILDEVFEDMMKFVFPDADRIFDFRRGIGLMDKELAEIYPGSESGPHVRHVDKLVKVYLQGGGEECIFIHIEVQGWQDEHFARRMFEYYYRIRDRYRCQVAGIAIFTGDSRKFMPHCYAEFCYGACLFYKFITVKIIDYQDGFLEKSGNLFAWIILAAKQALKKVEGDGNELITQRLKILGMMLQKGNMPMKNWKRVLLYLKALMAFDDKSIDDIFNEGIYTLINKKNAMNLDEYLILLERMEERERIVKNLIQKTEFSHKEIASLTNSDVKFVRAVIKEMNKRPKYSPEEYKRIAKHADLVVQRLLEADVPHIDTV